MIIVKKNNYREMNSAEFSKNLMIEYHKVLSSMLQIVSLCGDRDIGKRFCSSQWFVSNLTIIDPATDP